MKRLRNLLGVEVNDKTRHVIHFKLKLIRKANYASLHPSRE